MALRPRAVINTPYPSAAATARVLGVSAKRYREIRAMVTEYLERHGQGNKRRGRKRTTMRRRATSRS
jgi:uncharacterized protein YdaU (DUF1376 family)